MNKTFWFFLYLLFGLVTNQILNLIAYKMFDCILCISRNLGLSPEFHDIRSTLPNFFCYWNLKSKCLPTQVISIKYWRKFYWLGTSIFMLQLAGLTPLYFSCLARHQWWSNNCIQVMPSIIYNILFMTRIHYVLFHAL